jgi:hypothetical protein
VRIITGDIFYYEKILRIPCWHVQSVVAPLTPAIYGVS